MGCCLGTTAVNHRQPPKTTQSSPQPPSFEEKETVKEVLSETPILNPKTPPQPIINHPQSQLLETENAVVLSKRNHPQQLEIIIQDNVSDVSEMFSYSESFSAATTATVADTKKDDDDDDDDEGEVTQKVKNVTPAPAKRVVRRRPAGEFVGRKERMARPPARRQMAPSPEKRRPSPARTVTNGQRNRNVGPANDGRREVTSRRSRSPAVRGEMGQRRKVRDVEKSGELVPATAVESEGKSAVEMGDDGGVLPEPEMQGNESLENPLVSLECFIFL